MLMLLAVLATTEPSVPHLFEPARPTAGAVGSVMLGPVFGHMFMCVEHPEGSNASALGDAFGTDCVVVGGMDSGNGYFRLFRTDGKANADWYGWQADVLAPFDGMVVKASVNETTNTPGTMGKEAASDLVFKRRDGTYVVYAHVDSIQVKVGDKVKQGQVVAHVGNNGASFAPHIHIGAFKGTQPLQIRWDQRAEGRLPGFQ